MIDSVKSNMMLPFKKEKKKKKVRSGWEGGDEHSDLKMP